MTSEQRPDGVRRKRIPEQWKRLGSKPLSPATYSWDPETYDRVSAGQRSFTGEPILALDLTGMKRVIDLGCGTGWLAAELARRLPDAEVIGIDVSPAMIAYARKLYGHQVNCRFQVADARMFRVARKVDLIVSTAALHWIREQDQVLWRCAGALRLGGRCVIEMGGYENAKNLRDSFTKVTNIPRWRQYFADPDDPFTFSTPEAMDGGLRKYFSSVAVQEHRTALTFESASELSAWVFSVWRPLIQCVPQSLRAEFASEIARLCSRDYGSAAIGMVRIRASGTASRFQAKIPRKHLGE